MSHTGFSAMLSGGVVLCSNRLMANGDMPLDGVALSRLD